MGFLFEAKQLLLSRKTAIVFRFYLLNRLLQNNILLHQIANKEIGQ